MDANLSAILEMRINKTIGNLKNNKMDAYYAKTCQDAIALIKEICPEGQTVSCGGSVSLQECGVMELLRSGHYHFLDRAAKGADVKEVYHKTFGCDTFFTSSNAVTEAGELFNVDATGNRIAAMIYGPASVIVVVGYNKIVTDLKAAEDRLREYAAPANALRLNMKTPCKVLGKCQDCRSDERICCNYVVMRQQFVKGRIKVIIVGEPLGY